MKIYVIFLILFIVVFCTNNIVAQQINSNNTTEEKSTPKTVLRTANPNYSEQIITGVTGSSERIKNPNVKEEPNAQKRELEPVITNEKTKNPAH